MTTMINIDERVRNLRDLIADRPAGRATDCLAAHVDGLESKPGAKNPYIGVDGSYSLALSWGMGWKLAVSQRIPGMADLFAEISDEPDADWDESMEEEIYDMAALREQRK